MHGQLLGFVNIKEEAEAVFIGIGVRPDACNRHYGRQILEITSEIAKQAYPTKPLYLEVRSWNQRAIRCYENAGFKIVGAPFKRVTDIGEGSFYRMFNSTTDLLKCVSRHRPAFLVSIKIHGIAMENGNMYKRIGFHCIPFVNFCFV